LLGATVEWSGTAPLPWGRDKTRPLRANWRSFLGRSCLDYPIFKVLLDLSLFIIIYFLSALRFELRALSLARQVLLLLVPLHQSFFVIFFFF
jgi:hypothetical protein